MLCLLCTSPHLQEFHAPSPARDYFHCQQCDLIFMQPAQHLAPEEEKARYDLHENHDSPGYREFLAPALSALSEWPAEEILDYGCGPTAFLSQLAPQFRFENYDPFYHPNPAALRKKYSVIVSTEVWEHFHHPREELTKLSELLKPNGILAVMTSAHPGVEAFAKWSYRRDLTHVIFFSEKTMAFLTTKFPWRRVRFQNPLWVFQKEPTNAASAR